MGTSHISGPFLYRTAGAEREREWYEDMPIGNDLDFFSLFDDFEKVDDDQTNDWTVVKDTGASVGIVADKAGGELALTSTATTDNDGASIQGNEVFLPAAGKDIWFEARVKKSDADQSDLFVGLCENFATNPEACLTASNRIGFQIDDGNASILAKSEKADTETSMDTEQDSADATYVKLGFHVVGLDKIEFFVNRVKRATITTNIPIVEMAVAAFHLSGDANGTHVATLDYVFAMQTR